VQVVCLSHADRRLLSARFAVHGNSHRRMRGALEEAHAATAIAHLDALRGLERRFRVDLGSICWRYERRETPGVHPIERFVIAYITQCRRSERGDELWILLDRVSEIRDLMEGRLVGEPGS
jgi:hypothetical protein